MNTILTLLIAALGLLDGQSFQVSVGEAKGKLDTPHTLVFAEGQMRSPECSEWGFGAERYSAKKVEGGIAFSVVLPSKKEGQMTWTGTVKGKRIEGESVWKKEGQKAIRYHFAGRLQGD